MWKFLLLAALAMAFCGCKAGEGAAQDIKSVTVPDYIVWPSQAAYDGSDAIYIPMQAVPSNYPFARLIQPPQPFGPDKVPVSDGIAVDRDASGEVRVRGGELEQMAGAAASLRGERAFMELFWQDLNRCPASIRKELEINNSVMSYFPAALLCGQRMTVYSSDKKSPCALSRELVDWVKKARDVQVGVSGSDHAKILLYDSGMPYARQVNCADGTQRTLFIKKREGLGGEQLIGVERIFKVGEEWFMVATANTGDDLTSYVLFSFGSPGPLIIDSITKSKLYVSPRNALLVSINNNTLSGEVQGQRFWSLNIFDLNKPTSPPSRWTIFFDRPNDGGFFKYSARPVLGPEKSVEKHRAKYAIP